MGANSEVVTIRGKKFKVPNPTSLKLRIRRHMEVRNIKPGERVNQKELRFSQDPKDRQLYQQLGIHGWIIDERPEEQKTRNPGRALKSLGFNTRQFSTYDEVAKFMRRVFPRGYIDALYRDGVNDSQTPRQILLSVKEGHQVYSRFHTRHSDSRMRSFRNMLSSLYPDLEERWGFPVSEVLRKPPPSIEEITDKLTAWYYQGRNLSLYNGSLTDDERRITHSVDKRPLPGDFHPRSMSYVNKLVRYLQDTIPEIRPEDISAAGQSAVKFSGLIFEREVLFLLAALKEADPNLRGMGKEFRDYFPAPLIDIHTARKEDGVVGITSVKNGGKRLEADGRVICGSDKRQMLIEAKSYKRCYGNKVGKMADKYSGPLVWSDGTPIYDKVAFLSFLNGGNGDKEWRKILEDGGWKVIGKEQFGEFYRRGLEIFAEKEPDFFQEAAIPCGGLEDVLKMHELAHEKGHLLIRRGHRFMREWIASFLRENTKVLLTGQRYEGRTNYKKRYTSIGKELSVSYGKTLQPIPEGILFFDLETAGFRRTGGPIVVVGMGYSQNGEFVIDQRLVRTPLEEESVVKSFEKKAKEADEIVHFNGDSFDTGFMAERAKTNLVRQVRKKGFLNLDLMRGWRAYAGNAGFPQHRLQDYERVKLDFKRNEDLPGNKVPEVFRTFVFGGDDEGDMRRVVEHNRIDIMTMAFMYQDKTLPKMYFPN